MRLDVSLAARRVGSACGKVAERVSVDTVQCRTCSARADGLCRASTPETLASLARLKSGDLAIPAGADLFSIGEPSNAIFNLVSGWVFLYQPLEDGRRQILHFAVPGAVLGFHPDRGAGVTWRAQALTDAVVCVIPYENLPALAREVPGIGMRLAWLMSRDRSLAFDHLTSIGRRSARERVAHLILELFVRYRARWPGDRMEQMHLPLTQEHLGDALGLTAVHVNRVLRSLRKDGVIELHYRRLRILNPDRLLDVAGLDPHLVMSWIRKEPVLACPNLSSRNPNTALVDRVSASAISSLRSPAVSHLQ